MASVLRKMGSPRIPTTPIPDLWSWWYATLWAALLLLRGRGQLSSVVMQRSLEAKRHMFLYTHWHLQNSLQGREKGSAESKAAKDTHAPVVWRWGGCEGRTMWVAAMFLSGCSWDEKSTSALYFPWRELSMNHLGLILPQKQNWIQKSLRETMSITASKQKGQIMISWGSKVFHHFQVCVCLWVSVHKGTQPFKVH